MKTRDLIAAAITVFLLSGSRLAPAMDKADGSSSLSASAAIKAKPVKKMKARVKAKVKTIALSVTQDGFVPANIKLKKGEAYNLVVTRQTDRTCANQITIPGYAEATDLPLNTPVPIALVPKASGEIRYSCGMGMIHGVLAVE